MAEEKSSSEIPTSSVVITSTSEHEGGETDHSNPISSSDDSMLSGNVASSSSNNEENVSNEAISQSHERSFKTKEIYNDPLVSSSSENSNGVADTYSKPFTKAPNFILRPSSLTSGFNSFQWKNNVDYSRNTADSSSSTKSPLRSPKLNWVPSVLQGSSGSTLQPSKLTLGDNPFGKSDGDDVNNISDKDPVSLTNANEDTVPKTKVTESGGEQKTVSPLLKTNCFGNQPSTSSLSGSIAMPNFVFGQNLHERVSKDGLKVSNEAEAKKNTEATTSNGTSEMLFTSVLSKEMTNSDKDGSTTNCKDTSLYEDAARYLEAKSNKRKYEEVHITTGEEGEENIIQINVKLFAFDNGSWLERGQGTLRLNDRDDSGTTTSRIVIRTLGSLRVMLNTKIWAGMSLNRASERSIRLTALDANGQLKIFLIQSSPKDTATLYRCMENRLKRCREQEGESPDKKLALSSSSSSNTLPNSNLT